MINKDEVLELLDEAIERLPEELRAARWLLKEREEYLAKVRGEGDEILEAARARAERMVQRTEVVKAAEQRARHIVRGGRGRGPPPAPRVRGLLRPEAGQLRDRARAHPQDGAGRPREAPGAPRSSPRSRKPTDEADDRPGLLRPGPAVARSRCRSPRSVPRSPSSAGASAPAARCRRRSTCPTSPPSTAAVVAGEPVEVDARARVDPARACPSSGVVRAPWVGECRRCLRARCAGPPRSRCRRSSSARRPRARPGRSGPTRSTSSRWSGRRCCSSCRWRRSADEDCQGPCPTASRQLSRERSSGADEPRWASLAAAASRPATTIRARGGVDDAADRAEADDVTASLVAPLWPSRRRRRRRRRAAAAGRRPGGSARPAAASAPGVGSAKLPHVVCGNCGWYGGRQAIDVD